MMFCLDAKPKLFFWSGLWQDLIMASVCVHLYCLVVIDLIVGIRVIALSSPPLHHYSTYHHSSPSLHELLNWWGWWCPLEGSWVLSMCVCVCCNDNIGGVSLPDTSDTSVPPCLVTDWLSCGDQLDTSHCWAGPHTVTTISVWSCFGSWNIVRFYLKQ